MEAPEDSILNDLNIALGSEHIKVQYSYHIEQNVTSINSINSYHLASIGPQHITLKLNFLVSQGEPDGYLEKIELSLSELLLRSKSRWVEKTTGTVQAYISYTIMLYDFELFLKS